MIGYGHSKATTYYRSYSRALLKYVNNGFFARDLDADDLAYIERIRERGCLACGSLAQPAPTACTHSDDIIPRVALIEEMDFWQQPYQVDKIIVRRSGPVARTPKQEVGTTPAAIERQKRREIVAAARAEEIQRLEAKQLEQLRRDVEWERAAPKPKPVRFKKKTEGALPFGRVEGRHYVPQWKLDEAWEAKKAKLDESFEAKKERIKQARKQAALRQQARDQQASDVAATQAAFLHRVNGVADAARVANLKTAMLAVIKRCFPHMVTLEQMMGMTGCGDKDFLMRCADELVSEGKLLHKTEPA